MPPKPLRKRSAPLPKAPPKAPSVASDQFVLVTLKDAKMWAKSTSGATRVAIWTDVVRRMEKLEATGKEAVCRWWSAKRRRHPLCASHGALEVVAVELPKVSVRKRSRPAEWQESA